MKKSVLFILMVLFVFKAALPVFGDEPACTLDMKDLNFDISRTIRVGEEVKITAEAISSCSGDLYYRFDYIPGYGTDSYDPNTNFKVIQDYKTQNYVTTTFAEPGNYIIVAKVSRTDQPVAGAAPLIGSSLTVLPSQSDVDAAAQAAKDTGLLSSTSTGSYSTQNDDSRKKLRAAATIYNNGGCPEVTLDAGVLTRTLTLSYSSGCTVNGVSVSGSASGTRTYVVGEGFTLSLALSSFTVDGNSATGNLTIKASALQGAQVKVNADLTVTDPQNKTRNLTVTDLTATVNTNQTNTDPTDDTYVFNGTGTFTDTSGNQYTATLNNVTAKFGCYIPVSGTMTLENSTRNYSATVDFGDGNCDTLVTITIGGVSQQVDLSTIDSTT